MKRPNKSSQASGSKSPDNSQQLPLDWDAAAAQSVPPEVEPASGVSLTKPVIPKRPLRETVERFLRDRGTPYIAVNEAKKILFSGSGARLRSFHFVVYRPRGTNWLVHAAWLRPENRTDLKQWEEIFGPGFIAIVASQARDGALRFRKLTGEAANLDE